MFFIRLLGIVSFGLLTGCTMLGLTPQTYQIYNPDGLNFRYQARLTDGQELKGQFQEGIQTSLIVPQPLERLTIYADTGTDRVLNAEGEPYRAIAIPQAKAVTIPRPGGDLPVKILAEVNRIRAQGWPLSKKLTIFWPSNKLDCSAFYCQDGTSTPNVIHLQTSELVNGFSGLWHELGHAVMDAVYTVPFGSNCPTPHIVTEPSSLTCAWSEGWATFFAMLIGQTSVFCWPSGDCVNYEHGLDNLPNQADIEGVITRYLWDLWDFYPGMTIQTRYPLTPSGRQSKLNHKPSESFTMP
ncbi:hypothetical protein HYR54_16635 [Candidatus Acetothermia bacterium]|nr:hypothetical protein [Candidatus Acetothermia bacterium]